MTWPVCCSVVQLVQLFLVNAQAVVLCRIVHPVLGVYLCPREVKAKLLAETSRQTLANNINAVKGQHYHPPPGSIPVKIS